MKKLYLLKNHQRRLLQGHVWIYSNEVDTKKSSLKTFIPGEKVLVVDIGDAVLGVAYINPHSLITARLLTREKSLSENWLEQRIQQANLYRQQFYAEPYYRLVYGESDQLPGLVIDRYGLDFVVQINTAGMEECIDDIQQALMNLFQPNSILLRADSGMRALEQLPSYTKVLHGAVPDYLTVIENGTMFHIPKDTSQKTGWFYDHRENRAFLQKLVKGKKVLDVFSYLGGWGVEAAMAGAASVLCVDSSKPALEALIQNAQLNKLAEQVKTFRSDAFEALSALREQQESFDIVVVDPPAFIKRRKDSAEGMKAYHRINQQALKLIRPGGILVSASCSHHLSEEDLLMVIGQALAKAGRTGRLIFRGTPGFDHPISPFMPETNYLKAFFVQLD
jgi:23S rRNA (cytosine1962-C5)-methyltransferase